LGRGGGVRITTRDVLHVATLAELEVPAAEVEKLAAQLDRIVEYVAQLEQLGLSASAPAFLPGPDATPLRPDEVRPVPLARPPEELAPEFREGFFVVPKLAGLEDG